MSDIKIVGFTGPIASGKTTIAREVFAKHGYKHYSIGEFIKEIVTKGLFEDRFSEVSKYKNNAPSREDLIKFGREMRNNHGDDVFIRLIINDAKEKGYEKIVIDGIRGETEIETVQKMGGITIFLEANLEVLYQRFVERNKDIDKGAKDFQAFIQMLETEESNFGIFSSREMNTFIYDNNKTLDKARKDFENLLD